MIDFGTSQVFNTEEKMHQTYGTAYYIAPEVLKGDYNEKCDLWSVGVILYILLCGHPPFNGTKDADIIKKVKEGKYNFTDPIWKKRSQESMDLINQLLTYDPEKRVSALSALEHPWLKNKVKAKIDPKATQDALANLKSFSSE